MMERANVGLTFAVVVALVAVLSFPAFLPRIFAAAPQWWIDANPDEQIRYSNPGILPPDYSNLCQSIPRESFASEKCRRELGAVYRQAVRHLYRRYGRHLLGIHLANWTLSGLGAEAAAEIATGRCLDRINGIYRIVLKQVEQEMQELALCLSPSYFCISCSPC